MGFGFPPLFCYTGADALHSTQDQVIDEATLPAHL